MPASLFDPEWKVPNDLQLAALQHVYACLGRPQAVVTTTSVDGVFHEFLKELDLNGNPLDPTQTKVQLTPYMLANILVKPGALAQQAKQWAGGETPYQKGLGAELSDTFKFAGETVVYLLSQAGEWWKTPNPWPASESAIRLIGLLEITRLLAAMQKKDGREFWSLGFFYLPQLLLPGLDLQAAYNALATPEGTQTLVASLQAEFDPVFAKSLKRDLRRARVHNRKKKGAVQ